MKPVLACLLLVLLALAPEAQPLPDSLVWEPVGTIQQADWLDTNGDTLYTGIQNISGGLQERGYYSITPTAGAWSEVEAWSWGFNWTDLDIEDDHFFTRNGGNLRRVDDDYQLELVHDDAWTLPQETPTGTLVIGNWLNDSVAARSIDGGRTWTDHGGPEIGSGGLRPEDIVVLPPTPEAPLGRLVAAGAGGLATSSDDGLTWQPVADFGGGVGAIGWAAVRIAHGPHDGGRGGEVLAFVQSAGDAATGFYRSADGLAWQRADDPAGPRAPVGFESRMIAAPDGAVYVYQTRTPSGNYHRGAPIWRSADGGATWVSMGTIWEAWSTVPTEIAVSPDGRLWASAVGRSPDPTDRLGGVFRTVDPVVTVASAAPPEASGASLRVDPNPASASAQIRLTLPSPEPVTVAVFDARGREVWRGASGARGEHVLSVDTSAWAAGVYVVRAEISGAVVSAHLVVAR